MSLATNELSASSIQHLTFSLAGETYAIGILGIKEIIEYRGLTQVPMMPPSVCGVINLRGAVVPVIDLAVRFGKPPSSIGKRSCIVIVEIGEGCEQAVLGVMVDAVSEVLDIPDEDIEPAPNFGTPIGREFIAGIGKVRGKFVILLEVGRVLSLDELGGQLPVADESTPEAAT